MKYTLIAIALMFAQTAAPKQEPKPPTPPAQTAPPVPPPQLTDTEKLKIENTQLKFTLVQQQQQQLQAEYQALVQSLNAEHPGFTFNVQTNQFVATPKPPAPPAPIPPAPEKK